jgi:hypothetical protein
MLAAPQHRPLPSRRESASPPPYPKIELHVHLEATVRPATLLRLAGRNAYPLPADTVEGLAALCDEATRERPRAIGGSFDWESV